MTAEHFNRRSAGHLPGLAGVEILAVTPQLVRSRMTLPQGASGFTTLELKANFLGTAREGAIACLARPVHLGRTTQVWDAEVTLEGTETRLALFRCTQMVLWPK